MPASLPCCPLVGEQPLQDGGVGRNEAAVRHDHRTYAAKLGLDVPWRVDSVTVST